MAKYSIEFKLKLVNEYLTKQGGFNYIAKKYGMKSNIQIIKWVNAYKEFGEAGLLRSRKNKNYSVQFKLDTIELYVTTELSYQEVANQMGMNNPPLIANWVKVYRMFGIDGLSKQKGCPSKMGKKNSKNSKAIKNEQTELEKLEKENRMLKIENAYLKELRRLRLEDERKMRELPESSIASENNLD